MYIGSLQYKQASVKGKEEQVGGKDVPTPMNGIKRCVNTVKIVGSEKVEKARDRLKRKDHQSGATTLWRGPVCLVSLLACQSRWATGERVPVRRSSVPVSQAVSHVKSIAKGASREIRETGERSETRTEQDRRCTRVFFSPFYVFFLFWNSVLDFWQKRVCVVL